MAYATSIRERALNNLEALLGTMRKDQTPPAIVASPGFDQTALRFDLETENIHHTPLTEAQFRKNFSLAILEGDHTLNHQMQTDQNILTVTLEIFLKLEEAKEGYKTWNALITDLHRLLRADHTLSGIIANLEIAGNSVDVESYVDKKVDGAIFIRLHFKTAENDPRQIVPGVIPS